MRACREDDFEQIWSVINDGAQAYRGVVPADCLSDPYMPKDSLRRDIDKGVTFSAVEEDRKIVAVMGLQRVNDVTLIRHAYVRSDRRNRGLGGQLLSHLRELATGPILIGTWTDAAWAIDFYRKHGFELVSQAEKEKLLRTYWTISDRQIETSSVLADQEWHKGNHSEPTDAGRPSS